ncbi:MAG: PorT family protein [Bacteroidales bacterium]|jgi:hypothetical protein|nr:PorT family protein [Bacteroidales bacterium]
MKTITTLLCATVFCTSALWAQNFSGGIRGGGVTSQIDGDGMGGYNKFSPYGGLFVQRAFDSGRWAAQLEINYTGRGARSSDGNVRSSIGYAEIPLIFSQKLFFLPLYAQLGMAAAVKVFENTTTYNVKQESDDYGTWDFPIIAGAEVRIGGRLAADARFMYSMARLNNQFHNNAISFGLSYKIVK